MCAQRDLSTIRRKDVLSATQSTSSPNRERPSDLGRVDLALISKRKAALSPEGASRPQKLARTDTRMSLTETDVPSRSQHLFVSKAGILLSPTTKTLKKKVHLKRNHELVHSLVKSGHDSGYLGRDNSPFKRAKANPSLEDADLLISKLLK
ncbi:hypothetical protein BGW80DRAFT_701299 [Lactifluus volemus]|nr:hypothetical protein BGW80DRAFT_701299 [Lactifluus volemus]